MIKLAISGAQGRMGQAITKLAQTHNDFQIAALLEDKNHPQVNAKVNNIQISSDNDAIKGCDILIEFTLPEGTMENLKAAVKHGVKMVIATTGLNDDQKKEIEKASKKIPIVFASNMSIGVNVLFKLIEISGNKLGPSTVDISETHHVHKKDKPSGTAKTMAEIAKKSSGQEVNSVDSIREGEVVGYHEITFETKEDTLKITHNAKDRSMFAKGALTATKFLMDKKSGLFNMQDVLGLNE